MHEFQTRRTVAHSAGDMFDLVADVERYPEFAPMCESLTVRVVDGAVWIDNATVIQTDIIGTNGVIHVIDTVVLPGTSSPTPVESHSWGSIKRDHSYGE